MKGMKKYFFGILKVTEEKGRIRSYIWIHLLEVRIRTKMSQIPNTAAEVGLRVIFRAGTFADQKVAEWIGTRLH
jgi:hypothetical protein